MRNVTMSVLGAILLVIMLGATSRAQFGELPSGSYQQTCRDIRSNGSQLIATCRKQDGSYRNTALDTTSCRGNIVNDDGQLRCASVGTYGDGWQVGSQPMPPGHYHKTC